MSLNCKLHLPSGAAPDSAATHSYGRALLQLYVDNNADFMSGRSVPAPTCIGHGRDVSTLGAGTSVVDHVLRVGRDSTRTLTLPTCITLDQAAHGLALQLLASDHCPVMCRSSCAPHTRTASVKRSPRVTWRLELLRQKQERDAYQLAVYQLVRILHLRSRLRIRATNKGLIRWPPQWAC